MTQDILGRALMMEELYQKMIKTQQKEYPETKKTPILSEFFVLYNGVGTVVLKISKKTVQKF